MAIEREYGSGGTGIGKLLSEKTGIPYYGSKILEDVSKQLQVPVSKIHKFEESTTGSLIYLLYTMSRMNDGTDDMLSNEDKIFIEQQKLIREYAAQGPAVFVGRCAARALDPGQTLNVFVHADKKSRQRRIITEYGIPEHTAYSTMTKFDKKRKHYYSVNIGRTWTDWDNYQIVLDSGKLGLELCAEIIRAALG